VTGTQERHRTDATLALDQTEGLGTELLMLAVVLAGGATTSPGVEERNKEVAVTGVEEIGMEGRREERNRDLEEGAGMLEARTEDREQGRAAAETRDTVRPREEDRVEARTEETVITEDKVKEEDQAKVNQVVNLRAINPPVANPLVANPQASVPGKSCRPALTCVRGSQPGFSVLV